MLLPSTQAYQLWAPTYDSNPNPLLALEARLLSDLLRGFRHEMVVDVGCGTGRSRSLLPQVDSEIFGADTCMEMLAQGCRKSGLHGKLVQSDAVALPFRDAVADVTLCSFAVSYFSDLCAAFTEIARVTKSSGIVALSDLHPCAIASGWRRSFRVGKISYEIASGPYSDSEFQTALDKSGLRLLTQINSGFSQQERSFFVSAGKEHLFLAAKTIPAVRIGVYRKT